MQATGKKCYKMKKKLSFKKFRTFGKISLIMQTGTCNDGLMNPKK